MELPGSGRREAGSGFNGALNSLPVSASASRSYLPCRRRDPASSLNSSTMCAWSYPNRARLQLIASPAGTARARSITRPSRTTRANVWSDTPTSCEKRRARCCRVTLTRAPAA
jgi:hypothetical protein